MQIYFLPYITTWKYIHNAIGHRMNKRRKWLFLLLILLVISVSYGFWGRYERHMYYCRKCGVARVQYNIAGLTFHGFVQESDLSRWYKKYDSNHSKHAWEYFYGYVHYWFKQSPPSGSYDNFGFGFFLIERVHELQSELDSDQWNAIMKKYISIDGNDDNARHAFIEQLNNEHPRR
jgi:hypothetical protein